ncbi:ATP-binding cassette domain-containing protein [Vibrio mimicus]|uniref:ATP-binding cassette domain-containing protein n=1 Tax=Vibrio mimicus TaxID=674 RepID=UPI002F95A274
MIGRIPPSAKPWLIGSVISGVVVIVALVGQYWLVSRVLSADFSAMGIAVIVVLILLVGVRFALIVLHRYISAHTAAAVKQTLRHQLLNKLAQIQPQQLTPEVRGRVSYLLGEGIEVLDLYFGLFVPQFFIGLIGPLVVCVIIAMIDPLIGGILMLMIPLIPAILMVVFRRFARVSATYKQNLAILTELFTQSLHALPLLKLYRYSMIWGKEIEQHGMQLRHSTMALLKTNQLVILLVDLLFSLGTIVAASLLAVYRYQAEVIDAAAAGFIILASIELIRPLSLMGAFFFAGALGREVQAEVQSVMVLPENETRLFTSNAQNVVLSIDKLNFHYPQQAWLFRDLSITLRRGELVVLKGASGSGKSTLFKLIQGQLNAQSGVISSGRIGYLQQTPYIFDDTLDANCRIVNPQVSLSQIEQAMQQMALHHWLDGQHLDQQTGERGQRISGGQAARLGLCRALLSEASLLLIDEPTRQLDAVTEQAVIKALHQLKEQCGILVISHSPKVIAQADRVVDLSQWQTSYTSTCRCKESLSC